MLSKNKIKENYNSVLQEIQDATLKSNRSTDDVTLIPVSKTFPIEILKDSYEMGMKIFGESYAQELKEKQAHFNQEEINDIQWHFIGHLQRNKVKYIAPFVYMIHSVDSLKLAGEINKQAIKNNRKINILLQVNTSGEESKFGMPPNELESVYKECNSLTNIEVHGLMTITALNSDKDSRRKEFIYLNELKESLESKYKVKLKHLSMGMSGDFKEAIEEGATFVRVGSSIFGPRDYSK